MGAVDPREPFAQSGAVAVCDAEEQGGVGELELPELEAGGYDSMKHSRLYAVPDGFCGLRDLEIAGVSGDSGWAAKVISDSFRISNAVAGSSA